MPGTKAEIYPGVLENALFELVRQAVRAEVQEIVRLIRDEDRLLTIDHVSQRLSVSKDWVYRNAGEIRLHEKTWTKTSLLF